MTSGETLGADELASCDVLLRGKLAPPTDLLYRGADHHADFAFIASESIPTDLATDMKSRSNIGRKAHKPPQQQGGAAAA